MIWNIFWSTSRFYNWSIAIEHILADVFLILNKIGIVNYANDNMLCTRSNGIKGLIKSLEEASKEFFKCFGDNPMKSNPEPCHLLFSTNVNIAIRIGNFEKENNKREKLLGIQFDSKLSFNYHKFLFQRF